MPKRIDHAQRKREIAEKATKLFSSVGYENVSLIMIAGATGVGRTALYQYFCSKREVMDASITFVTDSVAEECTRIIATRGTAVERLTGVCHAVTDMMFAHKEFLVSVFDFVTGMVRTGADMKENIHVFTSGTREAIRRLVEHGKHRGEFAEVLEVERAVDILYSEFESCAMRIVLGAEKNAKAAKVRFSDIIRAIAAWR